MDGDYEETFEERDPSSNHTKCMLCSASLLLKVQGKESARHLVPHAITHLEVKRFSCSLCEFHARSKSTLKKHGLKDHQGQSHIIDKMHKDLLETSCKKALTCFPKSKTVIADWCTATFLALNKDKINAQNLARHENVNVPVIPGKAPNIPLLNGQFDLSSQTLISSMSPLGSTRFRPSKLSLTADRYKCQLCPSLILLSGSYSNQARAATQHASVHLPQKRYKCGNCGHQLTEFKKMKMHVKKHNVPICKVLDRITSTSCNNLKKKGEQCFPHLKDVLREWSSKMERTLRLQEENADSGEEMHEEDDVDEDNDKDDEDIDINQEIHEVPAENDEDDRASQFDLSMHHDLDPLSTNVVLKSETEFRQASPLAGDSKTRSSEYREVSSRDYVDTVRESIEVQFLREELQKKKEIIFSRDEQIIDLQLKLKLANDKALEEKERLRELQEKFEAMNEVRKELKLLLSKYTEW